MKARILIVEDEKTARQALSSLLADEGYEVLTAADGATARTLALQEEPDLILLDIRLPDIDGLTVLSPKWFKKAEVDTRSLLRKLDSFQQVMSSSDRALLDSVKATVQQVHDDLLIELMEGKKKK